MGQTLRTHLEPVRLRQQWVRAIWLAAWGLLLGALVGVACAAVKILLAPQLAAWLPFAAAGVGPVVGIAAGMAWRRGWRGAAAAVDDHYDLKDRATTALDFATKQASSSVHQLAFDDALVHLQKVNPREVVPLAVPRALPYGVALLVTVALLVLFAIRNAPAIAQAPETLDVVVAQAARVEEELKALEEFAKKEKDPEIEKLVEELKAVIEELKQPGVDAREALAKLSEMQAALQTQQAKNDPAAVDTQLQAVGEALALAEPLAEAGQALSSGQYEKAAEQLEKIEAPELDRKTEKAVKEKLDQAAKKMSENGQSSLSQATGEMSQGLGADGGKFREGSQKLAGEARKQGKKKKLMDLLMKQCNCLSECKCECEGESKSTAKNGKGKGGKKAGSGASGNELGERTAMFGNKKLERVTGKQSDSGEVETETTHSPEGTQDAQREYRENFAKYQKISESVLENEPIPLGHRQTIRRYFESIRPSEAEADKVESAVKGSK